MLRNIIQFYELMLVICVLDVLDRVIKLRHVRVHMLDLYEEVRKNNCVDLRLSSALVPAASGQ